MVHHSEALSRESGAAPLAEAVASGELHRVPARMAALCAYAIALTRRSASIAEAHLEPLRSLGFDDRAIVDANQAVAYFNYVNRIAHGLGVSLEERYAAQATHTAPYGLARETARFPLVARAALPWLRVAQMREVDRVMIEEFGIALESMMENAGRSLATLARAFLGGNLRGRQLWVLAGPGNNGGGGLVAARHLANAGAKVEVALAAPEERLSAVARKQLESIRKSRVPIHAGHAPSRPPDLVLDAVLGYAQSGAPRAGAAALIRSAAGHPVIALDVPSGLELETGQLHDPHILAIATLTLALPKEHLRDSSAAGELYVADISVPAAAYVRLGLSVPLLFGEGPIVRVAGETMAAAAQDLNSTGRD